MSNYHFARMSNSTLLWPLLFAATFLFTISLVSGQMSTDPRLCGGYQRDNRGIIDFTFNENTAPPGIATGKKFCMWTISPTVPSEHLTYNMTIRNVNLDCAAGDRITITYFNQTKTNVTTENQLCKEPHEIWETQNYFGTVMVVILYVEESTHGKGFYLEWKEGYDSKTSERRVRNTYYSFGRPSVDPLPYFAAGFFRNEMSTFGFIKGNYTQGYTMEMQFTQIENCDGQGHSCKNNTLSVFNVENDGKLRLRESFWGHNTTNFGTFENPNGFFIMVQIVDEDYAGGKFSMIYDTVRG